jgi:hypothetical protein
MVAAVITAAVVCGMIFMGALIGPGDPWVMLATDGEEFTVVLMPDNDTEKYDTLDDALVGIRGHLGR